MRDSTPLKLRCVCPHGNVCSRWRRGNRAAESSGDEDIETYFIIDENDIPIEGTEEEPSEIEVFPITIVSGIEAIAELTLEDGTPYLGLDDLHKIIPAPFASENFMVNTIWGDLVINPKPVTVTIDPLSSESIYGEGIPEFSSTHEPAELPWIRRCRSPQGVLCWRERWEGRRNTAGNSG